MIGDQRAISLLTSARNGCGPRFGLSGISPPRTNSACAWSRRRALCRAQSRACRGSASASPWARTGRSRQTPGTRAGRLPRWWARSAWPDCAPAGHRIDLDLAGLELRTAGHDVGAHVVDLASHQRVHGGRTAVERHERRLCIQDRIEHQAAGEEYRADAGVRLIELAVVRFHIGDEFLEVLRPGSPSLPRSINGNAVTMPIGSKSTSGR